MTLFVRKIGIKNWSKTTTFKILRRRSFFKKSIFCSAKDTSSCSKIFQNCFFFAENKVFKVEILFFAKVFNLYFIRFFHRDFYILDSGIVGLTENIMVLLRRSVRKTHLYMANMKGSLWSEPLI